jgi:hypothetical protein
MHTIAAPNITVQRTPMRSAMWPIRMPPTPTPIQPGEPRERGRRAGAAEIGRDRLEGNHRDPRRAERERQREQRDDRDHPRASRFDASDWNG